MTSIDVQPQTTASESRDGDHSPAPPALVLDDITMRFPDGTEALRNVSLSVDRGEFVGVVGPSGCGKSTILRIAAGLQSPTDGRVAVPDNLGYVFQDATLLPWRTVRRNIELFAELQGVPTEERSPLVTEAIRLVGLEGFEGHRPRQLSGGMKMRVSLARSLTLKPKVFLFDEPFGALDEMTRERLNDEVLALFQIERFAGLFITHSVQEAVYQSSRVMVMSPHPGRVVAAVDVPFDYPRHPDLRFTGEFGAVVRQVSTAMREGHR